jgi:hypothetical protein
MSTPEIKEAWATEVGRRRHKLTAIHCLLALAREGEDAFVVAFPTSRENFNMAEPAVDNASPLIFLCRAGLRDLLQLLSRE